MSTIKSSTEHLTLNADGSGKEIRLQNDGTQNVVLDSSGNVGIGTSSPSQELDISSTTPAVRLTDTTTSGLYHELVSYSNDLRFSADGGNVQGSTEIEFFIDGDEKMRIDSSGNVLVGKTSSGVSIQGSELRAGTSGDYAVTGTATSQAPFIANRLSSDGDVIRIRKDNTPVGNIGIHTGNEIYISNSSNVGLRTEQTGADRIEPCKNAGVVRDNGIDLGSSSARFDDIYATNNTIQTSDRNEKQDIEELTEAEQRVAVACKGLMRKFRWKSAVAEKGDDARIHFGIIAQDLVEAFEAEGLDAGRYAMFISTTWWETQTEVPEVEAVEAVYETQTDEDGNETQVLVEEAVEAKDAYTRTDTFNTQEEAPEGATERTRMGVRYSELLAFIISAI